MESAEHEQDHRRTRSDVGPSASGASTTPHGTHDVPPLERRSETFVPYYTPILPPWYDPNLQATPPAPVRNPQQRPEWEVPLFQDQRRPEPVPDGGGGGNDGQDPPSGLIGKVMEWLGYNGPDARARREFVSFVFNMLWWSAQVRSVLCALSIASLVQA